MLAPPFFRTQGPRGSNDKLDPSKWFNSRTPAFQAVHANHKPRASTSFRVTVLLGRLLFQSRNRTQTRRNYAGVRWLTDGVCTCMVLFGQPRGTASSARPGQKVRQRYRSTERGSCIHRALRRETLGKSHGGRAASYQVGGTGDENNTLVHTYLPLATLIGMHV